MIEPNPYAPPKSPVGTGPGARLDAIANSPKFAVVVGGVTLLGSLLALAVLVSVVVQATAVASLDAVFLLLIALVYVFGSLCGVAALRRTHDWRQFAGWFWLTQAPLVQSVAISYYAACGAGAWIILRFPPSSVGFGAYAYVGSTFRWAHGEPVPEVQVGVNALAAALAFVLLRRGKAAATDHPPRSEA
jgi:hypothetical protein